MGEILFLFFIFFIFWFFQGFLEKAKRQRPHEYKAGAQKKFEEYFEELGFPPLGIPQEEKKLGIILEKSKKTKKEKVAAPTVIEKEKNPVETYILADTLKLEENEFDLDEIEKGIIISEILRPPKAL